MRKASLGEKILTGKLQFSPRKITITSGDDTLYVHPPRASGYVHGDIVGFVLSRAAKDRKMAEAKPLKLIKRSDEEVIIEANISKKGVKWNLLPVFGNLSIEVLSNPRVESGDLYVAKFENGKKVRIIRKFGNSKDMKMLEELIYFQSGVRTTWPPQVVHSEVEPPKIESHPYEHVSTTLDAFGSSLLRQSLSLKESIFPKILVNGAPRLDFRNWYTLTIDGADAKDLDDAISIAIYEGGDTLLGVHIADVAEYVHEKSPIDIEAFLRGTSIYTPGRVIPMLPEILSNDLCSLHPGGPKLTLSILLRIDKKGMVKESFVTEGLIESRHRGVYEEIAKLIHPDILGTQWGSGENTVGVRGEQENDGQIERVYHPKGDPTRPLVTFGHESNGEGQDQESPLKEILRNFQSLYHTLSERRKKEGKIIFDTTECYFDIDDKGNVEGVRKRIRGEAHMMIEEFMVLANEEVAKWCIKRKIPFLSRVHDAPSVEKSREIIDILLANKESIGEEIIAHTAGEIEPHHIRSILEKASSNEELFFRFSRLLLPKMAKAVYGEKPVRHFGLALTHYAHFTSPIRRYPDLLLHRMIKYHLSKSTYFDKKFYDKQMKKWGESLSEKERTAEDVSRAVDDVAMCRYMSKFVGDIFAGIISGVTESNIYVELENGVEGSIYLSGKGNPKLTLDLSRGSLRNQNGQEVYQIGKNISVKIASVDVGARRIEMEGIGEILA